MSHTVCGIDVSVYRMRHSEFLKTKNRSSTSQACEQYNFTQKFVTNINLAEF